MADYIEITDEEIQPGAPYTTGLAAKMRDNHIALAQGAEGAPKILAPAIGDVATSVSDQFIALRKEEEHVVEGDNYVIAARFNIGQNGTVNISFQQRTNSSSSNSLANFRINGTLVGGTQTTVSTSYLTRNITLNVSKGDEVTLNHRSGTPTTSSFVRRVRLIAENVVSPWSVS